MKLWFLLLFTLSALITTNAQTTLSGTVVHNDAPVSNAHISVKNHALRAVTNNSGKFDLPELSPGRYEISVKARGFTDTFFLIQIDSGMEVRECRVALSRETHEMAEFVVTGTMSTMLRKDSPVPVESYSADFFRKNPTASLFDALRQVNGIQAQTTCNVCNTGELRINGMDGPYTLILIDGMPIVSALSTVYGLNGIPASLIERIEVVKGPASALYGSEAMGGVINVITKNAQRAPRLGIDVWGSSMRELNTDIALSTAVKKFHGLFGVNHFLYDHPLDLNKDGFTDIALQQRSSFFGKGQWSRTANRAASIAARYVYENRWGGDMRWNKQWRGTDSIYGESIYTRRVELLGNYQLPLRERMMVQASYNWHDQNSAYGTSYFLATQQVLFTQAYWDKKIGRKHALLAGASFRTTWYDDNTPATADPMGRNKSVTTPLPGLFLQDEWHTSDHSSLLLGYRADYHQQHGLIQSPRLAAKWTPLNGHTLRGSLGTGFRVVSLFTEDHAALTGAREVVIAEQLKPERSVNGNLNYNGKIVTGSGWINVDITGFYSHFRNRIIGDFDTDPNKIIYRNLRGYSVSRGISATLDVYFTMPLRLSVGATYMNVLYTQENNQGTLVRQVQLYAPTWSGTFSATYTFRHHWSIDLTGNWNGPMRLPVQYEDFRAAYSPWYCITNVQATKKWHTGLEVYGGIKNLLNFLPANPIMRPHDPFDKKVNDPTDNPHGYTFDTGYSYAPMQGIRLFAGIRYNLR